MPDRFGRPTKRELRSQALLMLSRVAPAGDPFTTPQENCIRLAHYHGACAEEIADLLGADLTRIEAWLREDYSL